VDGLRIERTYHGAGRFGPPKSGRARVVDVSPATGHILARLVDQAGPPGHWLFPGRGGRWPLSPAAIESAFRQAAALADLPEHFTIHSLRHSYASLLLAHGAPAQFVQQQLGHAHYAITVDLYGSWLRQSRPDLVALLDVEPQRQGAVRLERPAVTGVVIPLAQHRRRR
jgi:integrase